MRLDRVLIAVPLLGGVLLTGTAFAQGLGVNPSVRDVIYPPSGPQACQHNGLHVNKAGHSNCGRHYGWSVSTGTGSESGPKSPVAGPTPTPAGHGHKGGHPSGPAGESSVTHGKSGAAHGHSATHGNAGVHGHAGLHGRAGLHGHAGAHGHGGGKGHSKHGG